MIDVKTEIYSFQKRLNFQDIENKRIRDLVIESVYESALLSQNASSFQPTTDSYQPKDMGSKLFDQQQLLKILVDCETIYKADGEKSAADFLKRHLEENQTKSPAFKLFILIVGFFIFCFLIYLVL